MKSLTPAHIAASGRAIADVIGDAFCAIDGDGLPAPTNGSVVVGGRPPTSTNGSNDVGGRPPTSTNGSNDVGGRQLTFADLPPTFDELLARDASIIARFHLRERFTGDRERDAATLKANNARKKKPK